MTKYKRNPYKPKDPLKEAIELYQTSRSVHRLFLELNALYANLQRPIEPGLEKSLYHIGPFLLLFSIEFLLKSHICRTHGSYPFDHDPVNLFELLPEPAQTHLNDPSSTSWTSYPTGIPNNQIAPYPVIDTLTDYRKAFTDWRYPSYYIQRVASDPSQYPTLNIPRLTATFQALLDLPLKHLK